MKTATLNELESAYLGGQPLPQRIKMRLYVTQRGRGGIFACPYGKDEDPGMVFAVNVEFDVPPIDRVEIVEKQVAALEAERQKIMAEFGAKVQEIDERIQSLRALEWKPE